MPFEYSYALIKYRHDRAAGEMLNVGVALFCPEMGQVGFHHSGRYGRLSETFAGFDGDLYQQTLGRFQRSQEDLGSTLIGGLFQLEERERFSDVSDLLRAVWPDQGLAYFAGPAAYGVTEDLDRELKDLYDRFVLSQRDAREAQARHDDESVWNDVKKLLTDRGLLNVLQFKTLGPAEIDFPHAWKNDKWHVIEPISLDYASASDMKQRVLLTVGKATAVRDVEEFGTFTVIVARPRRIEAEKQYHEAMRLLADLPVPHEIVEEQDAERFASELQTKIERHFAEQKRDLEVR